MAATRSVRAVLALVGAAAATCALSLAVAVAWALATASVVSAQSSEASVFVPTATVYPGDPVISSNLQERRIMVRRPIDGLYVTDPREAIGKVAKRTLRAGTAIPLASLREPYAFKEGQQVVIRLEAGRLSISTLGVALQPGVVGEVVSLRNIDSGVVVRGTVRDDGTVEIGAQ